MAAPLRLERPDVMADARARAAATERSVLVRVFRRPPRLRIDEWSERYRYLAKEASPGASGRYTFTLAPYQREPMAVMSDPRVRRVVLMWGSQLGKSLILENAIGHGIHLRPRPMLMVQPKIDSAEGWSKERFAPMVRVTPVLSNLVRDPKRRDSENTLRMKIFPGGFLAIASSNSPAELAARAVARVFCDEIDRYEQSAGTEGDPVDLAERRMATVDAGILALTSTPGNTGESRIEPAYLAGDQRKFFVPCPHCGGFQELLFGTPTSPFGLKWDAGKPDTVAYLCEHCAALIEEKYKRGMLAAGQWIAQAPDHPYPSFFLNALYSPFGGTSWVHIVEKFLEAKGKPQRLKTFVNTFLAETWEEKGERVEADTLMARLEPTVEGAPVVPDWCKVLTAGVDTQDSYLELWVWAWGEGERSAPVLVEQIPGDPGTAAPWRTLDEFRLKDFADAAGRKWRIARGFVDSGGHHTGAVYTWARPRQKRGWFAIKGVGGEGLAMAGKPKFQGSAKVMLYPIGTFTAKEQFLRSQLHVHEPGPGFVHLPDWLTAEHLEQLTAEKLVTRTVKNKRVREWVKTRARNEALDCRVYAMAALHSLSAKWLRTVGILGTLAPRPVIAPEKAVPEGSDSAAHSDSSNETPPEIMPDEPPTSAKKRKRRRKWVTDY
jgi:phage terminase large subunit GpA-like protein